MNKELRIKNSIRYFRKIWNFVAHHNAPIIALELAIFVGIVFAFAATDNQSSLKGQPSVSYAEGEQVPCGTCGGGDEAGNSEQLIVNNEQTEGESDTNSIKLVILNIHTRLQAGDNWQVNFETEGVADLTIMPIDQATIDDLDFISLKCGNEEKTSQILENDVIFYSDWQCQGTGELIHLVNVAGKHTLKFQFGDQIGYAYNSPDTETLRPNAAGDEASITSEYPATKYEYYDTGDDASSSFYGDTWRTQTFTPSTAHKITSVKLALLRTGSPGTLTVSIKATDASGHPTGADLCSGTTNANTLPTSLPYEMREITLGNGYNLSANTKYAIVARALAGSAGNSVGWRLDYAGAYAGGNAEGSADAGVNWTSYADYDFLFEDWGEAAATHWNKVDEASADDDTTYVWTTSSTYQRDLYNLPASSGSGTINFIKVYFRCKLVGEGYAKPSLKSDSTVTDGTEVALTTAYVTYSQQWNTNPADGQAWEWADIDSLQIGIVLKGDGFGPSYCTQVYVEVDYTPVPSWQPRPPGISPSGGGFLMF